MRDLVLMIHPRTVLDSLKEASAKKCFIEINGFRGIGSNWVTGLANVFIAKGAAFTPRSRLSFISGTTKIVSSI